MLSLILLFLPSSALASAPSTIRLEPGQSTLLGETMIFCGNVGPNPFLSLTPGRRESRDQPAGAPSATLRRCLVDTVQGHKETVFILGNRVYVRRRRTDATAY